MKEIRGIKLYTVSTLWASIIVPDDITQIDDIKRFVEDNYRDLECDDEETFVEEFFREDSFDNVQIIDVSITAGEVLDALHKEVIDIEETNEGVVARLCMTTIPFLEEGAKMPFSVQELKDEYSLKQIAQMITDAIRKGMDEKEPIYFSIRDYLKENGIIND